MTKAHPMYYNCNGNRCGVQNWSATAENGGNFDILQDYSGGSVDFTFDLPNTPVTGQSGFYILDKLVWTMAFTGAYVGTDFAGGPALNSLFQIYYQSSLQISGNLFGFGDLTGNQSPNNNIKLAMWCNNWDEVIEGSGGNMDNIFVAVFEPDAPIYLCPDAGDNVIIQTGDNDFTGRNITVNRFVGHFTQCLDFSP